MKVLILGSNGQLGRCLNDQFQHTNHEVIFTSREQIDIVDFDSTKSKIIEISPDIVINAAAYTSVDKAEDDKEKADLINHLATANIAETCNQLGCWLIHISTDYVFDGNSHESYRENNQTNPQCIYGQTKLNGELSIQSSGCRYIIIRTAWVFSEYGNNFLKTMMQLASENDNLNIVCDQFGCPTYAQDLAITIVKVVSQLNLKKDNDIYHYCGDISCSWYDFANEIFKHAKANSFKIPTTINSIQTSDYKTPAKRPLFSVLDSSKIINEFDVVASNWREGIAQAMSKLQ